MIKETLYKHPKTAAFILGAFSVLGFAPFFYWPIYLITTATFFAILFQQDTGRQLFKTAWCFGFGFFTFGLYWIAIALHVDLKTWWWAAPFAVIGLPFILSFFYGLAGLALHKHSLNNRMIIAIISFSMLELARGHLFTGFPWNLPAYIWIDSPIDQNLSWAGAYGMSFFAFAICSLFARKSIKHTTLALIIITLLYSFGLHRLHITEKPPEHSAHIKLVQPNISQKQKWDTTLAQQHLDTLTQLSKTNIENETQKPDLIIWPESALPIKQSRSADLAPWIETFIDQDNLLLTGATHITEQQVFYNTLAVIDHNSHVTTHYNKHHLVPFGEYIPFQKILSFTPLSVMGSFQKGQGPQTLTVNNIKISPLICYEVIFPQHSFNKQDRPDLIVNVTNDGWYLNSTGPHQHLAIAKARAIETGIPLARVANTGISAYIDAYGRVADSLPLQTSGALDIQLTRALPPTFFSRFGLWVFFLQIAALSLLLLITNIFPLTKNNR